MVTVLGSAGALGLFIWHILSKATDRTDRKIERLDDRMNEVQTRLAGLVGELRGRHDADFERFMRETMDSQKET